MEMFVLCAALLYSSPTTCWTTPSLTVCLAEAHDWADKAIQWTSRNKLNGEFVTLCMSPSEYSGRHPEQDLLNISSTVAEKNLTRDLLANTK